MTNFDEIKAAAAGRWREILSTLTPLTGDELAKSGNDHHCPRCGGQSVIWPAEDAEKSGRIACRTCTKNRPTGDGIATVAAMRGCGQAEAARLVAELLDIPVDNRPKRDSKKPSGDLIPKVCNDKRMPIAAFMAFKPTLATRGRERCGVVRVPVYNGRGEAHSYFDFSPGQKGWFARGKGMSGMFFPGRLPKPSETWLVVEGCKDAAALIGLGFNAAGLPTSTMAAEYARLFDGVDVVLVPDLDTAGQAGAQRTGGQLSGIAASVKIARLPGEVMEKSGPDVRDCIYRHGQESVRKAVSDATAWLPREGDFDANDGCPEVFLTLNYGWAVDQVLGHLANVGWSSPWIPAEKQERLRVYQRDGRLLDVVSDTRNGARIRSLPIPQLKIRIQSCCRLMIDRNDEVVPVSPPDWLTEGIHTMGEFDQLKRLEGIVTAPTLRADGSILQTPGYDEATGLIYQPNAIFPDVPSNPTLSDAQQAALQLLEVISDVEFVDEADRSAWLSQVLTLIGRQAIDGCCPMFTTTANTRGSGKGLTTDAATLIAYGKTIAKSPYSTDDNEQRKTITSIATENPPAVLLDNIDQQLGGAALDAVLTAGVWSDRVLGSSATTGELSVRTVWMATGNNLRFGADTARRVLPIRLTTSVESPEEREGFQHPDLLGWVKQNRPRLAVAALTILRAYFVAGQPGQTGATWGSYQAWSNLIRGALVWAGLPDPLKTRETAKAEDNSQAVVAGLIGGMIEVDEAGEGLTVRQIVDVLEDPATSHRYPAMRDVVAEVATVRGRIDQRRLAYALRKYRGRVTAGYTLDNELNRARTAVWFARPVVHPKPPRGAQATHDLQLEGSEKEPGSPHRPPCDSITPTGPAGPPCDKCKSSTVMAVEIGGWANADCPQCGHVKPIRTREGPHHSHCHSGRAEPAMAETRFPGNAVVP